MITYIVNNFNRADEQDGVVTGKNYVEIACLSTDTKPTGGIVTGSIATEVNTGKVFLFDEAGGIWVEQFSLQS